MEDISRVESKGVEEESAGHRWFVPFPLMVQGMR